MKKIYSFLISALFLIPAFAQNNDSQDTVIEGKVTIYKDSRLNILAKKEAAFNEANGYSLGPRSAKGYRLMLLSTNDRPAAMRLRAQLLQRFPEQKVYMSFQPPYIKLRFGNFVDKADADKYKKEITRTKLVTNNIYLLNETIEVKPDKDKEKEKETN